MVALLPKAFVSWNSGKNSAYPLLEARRQNIAEIVVIITTINTTDDRIAVHGVRPSLLTRQAAALGLPLIRGEPECEPIDLLRHFDRSILGAPTSGGASCFHLRFRGFRCLGVKNRVGAHEEKWEISPAK
jgi:hypothetical protein